MGIRFPEQPDAAMRRIVMGILVFGMLGTGAELWLMEHTADLWQLAPLLAIGVSLLVLAWHGIARGALSLRVFQGTMILFLLTGAAGLFLHFKGNIEFELEMYPSRSGTELFWEAMKGATPALAPGTMAALGALGLAYTYQHPALTRLKKDDDQR